MDYKAKFPRKIKLFISDKNRGITENSNIAFFSCVGKYISFMAGDDLMLPEKLTKQVEFMEKHPKCTISYHDLDVFDSETGKHLYFFSEKNQPREGGVKKLIRYGCFNGACSTMIRRERAPANGFNNSLPVASDWFFNIECLNHGGEILHLDEVLGRYRKHEFNVTNRTREKMNQNDIDSLNSCNLVLSIRPDLFNDAIYALSLNIRRNRHDLPYVSALLFRMKFSFDIKCIAALFLYLVSFGKIRV